MISKEEFQDKKTNFESDVVGLFGLYSSKKVKKSEIYISNFDIIENTICATVDIELYDPNNARLTQRKEYINHALSGIKFTLTANHEEQYMAIDRLFLEPKARRNKNFRIGSQTVEKIEALAKRYGCIKIELTAKYGSEKFWEKKGFEKTYGHNHRYIMEML